MKKTIIIRICIIFGNILLAAGELLGLIWGLILISPYPLINFGTADPKIYISDFVPGAILLFLIIAVPLLVNLIMYKKIYKKKNIHKAWAIAPAAIMSSVAICLITLNVYNEWHGFMNAQWIFN